MQQVNPKLHGFKQYLFYLWHCLAGSFDSESHQDCLQGMEWGCSHLNTQLGSGPASKLVYVVVGRIQFLKGLDQRLP